MTRTTSSSDAEALRGHVSIDVSAGIGAGPASGQGTASAPIDRGHDKGHDKGHDQGFGAVEETQSPAQLSAVELGALVAQVATGDEPSFAALYDLVAPRVYAVALRLIKDSALAEEVAAEVMVEIWRTAPRFDPTRGSPMAWIVTLAKGRAIDRVRAVEASRRRDHDFHFGASEVPFDITAEMAHRSLEAQRVHQALAELSPTQKDAIELAYICGLSHTEVATELGIPLGTAKTRIRDGLFRLRQTLGQHHG